MVDPGNATPPPPPPPTPTPGSAGRPRWLPWAIGAGGVVAAVAITLIVTAGGDETPGSTLAVESTTTAPAVATTTTSTTIPPTTTTTTVPITGGSWTVMSYIMADNNLEPVLAWDLEEMAGLPPTDDLTLVALVDRSAEFTDREIINLPNWETAKVIRVEAEQLAELEDQGELNLGDPAVLTDFVTSTIAEYPADHYAVVFWDHGSPAGVGGDESHGDLLQTSEIAAGLRDALDRAGVDRLDFVGFDACLMGAYDVAVAMEPVARYLIASEELEPGTGWDYSAFEYVADYPEGTIDGLGRAIVSEFVGSVGESEPNVTLAMIDLDAIGELRTSVEALSAAMAGSPETFAPMIGRERARTIGFGTSPNPEEDFFQIDLGQFLRRLADAEPGLAAEARAAWEALDAAVIDSQVGPASVGATGLSVYFPPYPEYYRSDYYDSFAASEWQSFLDTYYTAGGQIPEEEQPDFTPVGNTGTFYFDEYGITVGAEFGLAAQDNAVDATLYSGVIQGDGSIIYYGEDQGFLEGSFATGSYDLTVLLLDDGEDQVIAYQVITVNEDVTVITLEIPLAYYPPGSDEYTDAILSLVYDTTTEEFTETLYGYDETGTIGFLDADPTGQLIPSVLVQYPDGTLEWEATSDIGVWADIPNLLYDWQTLEVGTPLHTELWVCDFGGNCDFAVVETEVPAGSGFGTDDGVDGGDDTRNACVNELYGMGVIFPDGWSVWSDPDLPELDCAMADPSSLDGMSADQAYEAASLTIELALGRTEVDETITTVLANADVYEDVTVAGFPAIRATSMFGIDLNFYLVQVSDEMAVMITGWSGDPDIAAAADLAAETLVIVP